MAQSEQEILEGLAEIVNEETGLATDSVQPDKSFTEDLDIDSLSMMTIVVNAEEKFGVRIPDEDVKTLVTVRDAVVTELADVADAISEVDQSYSYGAITAHCAETAGTEFTDNSDFCELPAQENDQDPADGAQCVDLCIDDADIGGDEN